jgi:hypothetical protein
LMNIVSKRKHLDFYPELLSGLQAHYQVQIIAATEEQCYNPLEFTANSLLQPCDGDGIIV